MSDCIHYHPDGSEAIKLLSGFPDRQPRGICFICHEWIHPKEWRTDSDKPPYLYPAHKDYDRVPDLWAARP